MTITTNAELYRAVTELFAKHEHTRRSLEEFLRALRPRLQQHAGEPAIAADAFVALLDDALTFPPPPADEGWREEDLENDDDTPRTAEAVDGLLRSQILDMEDAAAGGLLEDDLRYFGKHVDRPPGARRANDDGWFNWDPLTFIECGVRGTFGDDDADRAVPLEQLTWEHVGHFLWAGQNYE